MATQTYKYFKPSAILRAAYGGGAVANNADTAEVDKQTLMIRELIRQTNSINNGTSQLSLLATDAASDVWAKVSDNVYSGFSSYLTVDELATVSSTAPVGYTASSLIALLMPDPNKLNIFLTGDSITDGLGADGVKKDIYIVQALKFITGETPVFSENDRVVDFKNYRIINNALGGSSNDNQVDTGGGTNAYPLVERLRFPQRLQTCPLKTNDIIYIWLGTNDLNYDTTQTGATVWARLQTTIGNYRAQFPTQKIAVATIIKRLSDSPTSALNTKINNLNILIRAGAISAGADFVSDHESVSVLSVANGLVTNTTYYTDQTHITTAAHILIGQGPCATALTPYL